MPNLSPYQEQFRQETLALHHHRVYYILMVGMVTMLLFIILDYILVREHFSEFLRYRLLACGGGGLLMLINYRDQGQQRAWLIGFAGYICAGIVILILIMRMGGISSPYYVGLIVVMTIYTTIAPLTLTQTLISGFSLVSIYLLAIVFLDPDSRYQLLSLFSNLFFMVCFVCITATQSWADTAARARECALRNEEKSAAEELTRQADSLEVEVRKRVAEQEASEELFRLLYESLADDVVLVSPQGAILQANASFQHHFGNLAAGSLLDSVGGQDRNRLGTILEDVVERQKPVHACQLTFLTQTGTPMETEISGVLLRRAEKVLGAQFVIRDIGVRKELEGMLIESLKKVRQTENAAILALAKLSEYRDITHANHLERIREYCRLLALELSRRTEFEDEIDSVYIQNLYQGAILHDIGKVAIADEILLKTETLTEQEQTIFRNHTVTGGDVIKAMEKEAGGSGFLSLAKSIAYFHHEHWDGGGYPYGLQGTEIPLAARIMALADAYEELTSAVDLSHAIDHQQAVASIMHNAGSQFDPAIVEAFVVTQEAFDQIRCRLADTD